MHTSKCAFHPDVDAIAKCETCGKDICDTCKRTIDKGHMTQTATGFSPVVHSYHTVCPECEAKFKTKVKNVKLYGGIILIVTALGVIIFLAMRR